MSLISLDAVHLEYSSSLLSHILSLIFSLSYSLSHILSWFLPSLPILIWYDEVASYVAAALEADQSWARVERFFISSIEGSKIVQVPYPATYLPTHPPTHLRTYLAAYLAAHPPTYPSTHLPGYQGSYKWSIRPQGNHGEHQRMGVR